MDLPPELRVIHEPARLRIMGVLQRERRVRMAELGRALELTDGNLQAHVKRLEDEGLVAVERRLRAGAEAHVSLTGKGADAFASYVSHLRDFLERVAKG
jgi:DNA-binding MarR family transcriptional regulator